MSVVHILWRIWGAGGVFPWRFSEKKIRRIDGILNNSSSVGEFYRWKGERLEENSEKIQEIEEKG